MLKYSGHTLYAKHRLGFSIRLTILWGRFWEGFLGRPAAKMNLYLNHHRYGEAVGRTRRVEAESNGPQGKEGMEDAYYGTNGPAVTVDIDFD